MTPLVNWDRADWGQPPHNVHEASWAADRKHGDETDEETA